LNFVCGPLRKSPAAPQLFSSAANAGIALAIIIAAMSAATDNTISMRLNNALPHFLLDGRRLDHWLPPSLRCPMFRMKFLSSTSTTTNMTGSREHVKPILEAEVAEELVPTELGERVASIHRAAEKEGVLGKWASGLWGSRKSSFRRCRFSETRTAPVLLAQVLPDRTPCIGPATSAEDDLAWERQLKDYVRGPEHPEDVRHDLENARAKQQLLKRLPKPKPTSTFRVSMRGPFCGR
jgi:hypothetical protein